MTNIKSTNSQQTEISYNSISSQIEALVGLKQNLHCSLAAKFRTTAECGIKGNTIKQGATRILKTR